MSLTARIEREKISEEFVWAFVKFMPILSSGKPGTHYLFIKVTYPP
jgi:hypothetical protein